MGHPVAPPRHSINNAFVDRRPRQHHAISDHDDDDDSSDALPVNVGRGNIMIMMMMMTRRMYCQ